MALIEKQKGRRETQSPSGYIRLFGIPAMGNLISRIQAAVISAGSELEHLIWDRVNQVQDLDKFIADNLRGMGEDRIFVANKQQVKNSKSINSQYEPDFLAFNPRKRECYIIEVKDGDTFDTKKAAGEHATLKNFTNDIAEHLPFTTKIYLCAFNCKTKDEAFVGLKGKFSRDELLTGQELSVLLGFDYNEIVSIRTSDQQNNLDYFVNELLKIGNIRNMIVKRLKLFKEDKANEKKEPVLPSI